MIKIYYRDDSPAPGGVAISSDGNCFASWWRVHSDRRFWANTQVGGRQVMDDFGNLVAVG